MGLELGDPLAHRALEGLLRAEAAIRRRLSADIEREGLSGPGFGILVVLTTAGGALPLRTVRRRLRLPKASASELAATLESRGLAARRRGEHDRRSVTLALTPAGAELVDRLFPEHAVRVQAAFAALDADEKRTLAALCRRLAV